MKCEKCGFENDNNAVVCMKCGNQLVKLEKSTVTKICNGLFIFSIACVIIPLVYGSKFGEYDALPFVFLGVAALFTLVPYNFLLYYFSKRSDLHGNKNNKVIITLLTLSIIVFIFFILCIIYN